MDHFTISDLEAYSGIKAHTIRAWEQRYNALQPGRSAGNTRYYDNSQLRRLLNIVSMVSAGHRVVDLCSKSDAQLFELVNTRPSPLADQDGYFISQLIAAGLSYDEFHFEKIFGSCLLRYGLKDTYLRVICPMLDRIGLMWAGGAIHPPAEHFISNLLRQKLFTAIDALPPPGTDSECWLLFLPEDEFHELGLLMSHYLIRTSGRKSVYIGSNIPASSLSGAISAINADRLLLFLVRRRPENETKEYLHHLKRCFNGERIYVAAPEEMPRPAAKGNKIQWLTSVESLEQLLK